MESSAPFVGVFHENFTKKLPRNFPDNRMQKGSPIISNFLLRSLFFNCILFFVVINSVDSAHQSVVFYNEISPSVQKLCRMKARWNSKKNPLKSLSTAILYHKNEFLQVRYKPQNAESPIEVTLSGIVILVSPLQPTNASSFFIMKTPIPKSKFFLLTKFIQSFLF